VEVTTISHCCIKARLSHCAGSLICLALFSSLLADDRKLTEEELASQHLKSMGPVEQVLEGIPFRVALGVCTCRGRVFTQAGEESGAFRGEAGFVTGPDCVQFSVQFQSEHYPIEGFNYDGKEIRLLGFEAPRISGLSEPQYNVGQLTTYVPSWEKYVQEGLFGGTLNTSWPLLKPEKIFDKLRSIKRRNLEGKQRLTMRYHVGGSRGAELFFDPETFRHVATRFRLEKRRAGTVSIADPKQRVTLWEKFSDFEKVDGLELPTRWTITLELPRDTSHWEIDLHNLRHTKGPELKNSSR